jgi:hypothetical protein
VRNFFVTFHQQKMAVSFDATEFIVRLSKYLMEGIVVAIAAYFFPSAGAKLSWDVILLISLTASSSFALLDFFAPSIGATARQGAGFGIGANLVGFPR